MKSRSWITLGITVLLIVVVSIVALRGVQVGKYIFMPVSEAISLGLDLRGGISTEYVAKDTSVDDFNTLMDGTVEVLRSRLTNSGFTEATVARQGNDRIRVEIPDVSDPEQVIEIIGRPAHLEFREPDGTVVIEGKDIKQAYVAQDQTTTQFEVAFSLTDEGAKKFAEATARLVGSPISIYLDEDLVSIPTVQTAITGGRGTITLGNL